MDKEKFCTAKNINDEIEALDRVGVELYALSRKFHRGTIENKTLVSFFNQNLNNIHELQGKFEEV